MGSTSLGGSSSKCNESLSSDSLEVGKSDNSSFSDSLLSSFECEGSSSKDGSSSQGRGSVLGVLDSEGSLSSEMGEFEESLVP